MSTPLITSDVTASVLPYRPFPVLADPFQPISLLLERAEYPQGIADPYLVGDPTPGDWIPAASLVDGSALGELLDAPTRRWGAAPHAAAALAWKGYTYWLTLPAVLMYAIADRVPLLHADNVLAQLRDEPPYLVIGLRRPALAVLPGDEFADLPDTVVVPDHASLRNALADSLVAGHLAPLAAATRARVRIGSRILSGAVAASVGYAAQIVQKLFPEAENLTAHGTALLETLRVAHLVDLEETPGGVEVRRRTCCLAFTVPGFGVCEGCCIPS